MEVCFHEGFFESQFVEGKISLISGADLMELGSRIFIDGQWFDVPLDNGSAVRLLNGLKIQWHTQQMGRWFTLRGVLTNSRAF